MKSIKKWLLPIILLCVFTVSVDAQKRTAKADSPELDKVKNMVSFLEYMLNTLGSDKTSARDKDVLVTESYSKIFRDAKVQIEDDLDENRDVITNKDVPAYLKDVDFFFTDVKFEFTIEDIQEGKQNNDNIFYKVTLQRNLNGTTIEGKAVNNTEPRYIEINYDPNNQDLKIVSIYTHEFDESKALAYWWSQLSYEWQSIFKRKLNTIDSVGLADLKAMTGIESLDLSGNPYIQDIEPLSQLPGLRTLNLSHTTISDITPIRNLTGLASLDISYTQISDLSALRYASGLKNLAIGHTPITDISILEKMPQLTSLDLTGNELIDYRPLSLALNLQQLNLKGSSIPFLFPIDSLSALTKLDLSNTAITNLDPIGAFQHIEELHLDSTRVADIGALGKLKNLKILYVNHTLVSDLSALKNLPNLQRVYCDHTSVTQAIADEFRSSNPNVLIVFDSEDLKSWWATLSTEWQNVLRKTAAISSSPSKEELARVTNLDSINLSNQPGIKSLEPLRRLKKLQRIDASHTNITSLAPLENHREIVWLDVSHTQVNDLSLASRYGRLKILNANNTSVQALHPELGIPSLEKLYVDETDIGDSIVVRFLKNNPSCLVVYKTAVLQAWWKGLSGPWQKVFRTELGLEKEITTEQFHHLIEGEKLHFADQPVDELSPLDKFIRLKEIHFSGTAVTDLTPLAQFATLQSLHATHSPIRNFSVLKHLTQLEDLNISDTPLDDLEIIPDLQYLRRLDCSGTLIRNLNELEALRSLDYLDCSNTAVRRLDPVTYLSLKTLRCYNTKISDRRIQDFKASNPECEVVYYR